MRVTCSDGEVLFVHRKELLKVPYFQTCLEAGAKSVELPGPHRFLFGEVVGLVLTFVTSCNRRLLQERNAGPQLALQIAGCADYMGVEELFQIAVELVAARVQAGMQLL